MGEAIELKEERMQQEEDQLRREDDELRRQNAQIRQVLLTMKRSDPNATAGESLQPHKTKGWAFPFITISLFTLSIFLAVGYKAYDFMYDSGSDLDGDGDVDIHDFIKHCSCGLSGKAWRNIALVMVFSSAGFAFLWWMGFMQPILGQIVVYCYLVLTAIGFGSIFLAEAWSDLMGATNSILDVVNNIQKFTQQEIEQVEEAMESVQTCCVGGKKQPTPQAGGKGAGSKGASKGAAGRSSWF